MIKAAILGADGYTGLELVNILSNHKNVAIAAATSRSNAGKKISSVFASLTGSALSFCDYDLDYVAKSCDVVFSCLPHGAAAQALSELFKKGLKIIDLSADFRYSDVQLYEKTYNICHCDKELNKKAVYGLCEIYREQIAASDIVANPGCYTTCSILPLYPLLKSGAISSENIIIDAKSGITGAGRKAELAYNFCEADSNFKAYGITTHRHTTEIEEQLSFAAKKPVALSFTPHLLPLKRGILSTIYCDLTKGQSQDDIRQIYFDAYNNEQFVHILEEGVFPELKFVVGSNNLMIGFRVDKKTNKLIIISALDNLLKGAAGQAVQNLNIMYGFDQAEGLSLCARYL